MSLRTVSVVVNNYNYGRYLGAAVASALAQTHPATEVIVVDDGSTDASREVIAGFADRVIPILKENGGQASAFNAGFARSRGDVVLFLDADDVLLPTAAAQALLRLAREPRAAKAHWKLREIGPDGAPTGGLTPSGELPDGDIRSLVLENGPAHHVNPPTSGNAWSRGFLERVLPMPEAGFAICADVYLLELAPLYGPLLRIDEPQSLYRIHGANHYITQDFDRKLAQGLELYDRVLALVADHAARLGLAVDANAQREQSWFHRLSLSLDEIAAVIDPRDRFLLADLDEWGLRPTAVRWPLPFPERDGVWWGVPADDAEAIAELERERAGGVGYLVVAWPAAWWLEHFSGFARWLRERFACVLENPRICIFDLHQKRERS